MGGKSGTTTQSVSIPPEVLARYNSVNAQAQQVAATPFQPYTGQFVAGLTPTQQAGIQATSQYSQAAQPYYQAATGQLGQAQGQGQQAIQAAFGQLGQGVGTGQQYAQAATGGIGAALQYAQPYQTAATQVALAGGQQLTPENINIGGYMNPYTQAVADTTYQALRQQQQQEMQGATANAIKSGAFGGDRAGLVAANLARQQQLGTAQAMAPIYQQGYGQALGTAMTAAQSNRAALQNLAQQLQGLGQAGYGQQIGAAQQLAGLGQQQFGQGLGAAQQLGALGQQQYGMGAGTAQQLAALGTGSQQAALQGAQAQLGAGTLEQQTQQADLTARYQQFLQERGYPFQVAQFLANIAMGTGALSGSTTTTTQPMPFFSDRRVKDDVKEIGKTHDGLPIYSYKYKGDDQTQIGLMAQDVEKKHPEAVYDMGGVKGVDYKQATEAAERPERYAGGLVPESQGGSVFEPGAYARGGYAPGGLVDPNDIQALLAAQREAMGPFGEGGIYGQHHAQDTPFGNVKGVVPPSRVPTPRLITAGAAPQLPDSGAKQAMSALDTALGAKERYEKIKEMMSKEDKPTAAGAPPPAEAKTKFGASDVSHETPKETEGLFGLGFLGLADGGVVPRSRYAVGGMSKDPSLPYEEDDKSPYKYFPTEILDTEKAELPKAGQPPAQTSQSGLSLGTVLGFLFNQGGSVPRGRYAEGGLTEEERMMKVLQSDVGPFKVREDAAMTKGVDPRLVDIARKESVSLPEGEYYNFASGVRPNDMDSKHRTGQALDVSIMTPEGKALPNYQDPRYFTDYEDPAKVGRGIQQKLYPELNDKYAWGGYFSGPPGKYGAMDLMHRSIGETPQGGSWEGGVKPEQMALFEGYKPSELPARGAVPASGSTSAQEPTGIMPRMKSYLAENQDWLVPFGAGLKGMVQSRSPFLGGALLEGIGSGLEAVGGAQKQLADIGLTKASTESVQIEAGKIYERGGRLFVPYKDPRTGQIRNLKSSDYFRMAPTDRPPVSSADLQRLEQDAKKDAGVPVPTGETVPSGETPKATIEAAPTGGVKVNVPGITPDRQFLTQLDPAEKQQMDATIRWAEDQPNAGQNIPDKYGQQAEVASEIRALELNMANLGVALAALPKGQSLAASGAAQTVLDPITRTIDNLSKMLTGQNLALRPEDLTNKEIVGKAISNLSAVAAQQGNQRAYAALQDMATRFPTLLNSKEGQAALWSELRAVQQKELDKDDYFRTLRTYAEQNGDPVIATRTGRDADAMFDAKYKDSLYKDESKKLEKMFMDKVVLNGQKMPYSWVEYIYKNPQLPDAAANYIRQTYGQNILRYFGK